MQDALKQGKRHYLDGAYLVAHLADAKELDCRKLGWGDEEARLLAAALEDAHAQGALKALETLDLHENKIGDEGLRHLGDALARGVAPALKSLVIGNPASAAAQKAQKAVQDALKTRNYLDGAFLVAHFADAKKLDCRKLGWGDEEARRFAAALEHATAQGALKALVKIDLSNFYGTSQAAKNKIGDEGLRHLGDALARGAAPALKELPLGGNPASDAAQQAVQDALRNRK